MDETGKRLSEAGLRLFSKEMSPEYEHVHKMLLGHLAAHGATFNQLLEQEVNDSHNVEMLSEFLGLLPAADLGLVPGSTHQGWRYITTSEWIVKNIQSHVLWHKEASGEAKVSGQGNSQQGYRPYVLLGSHGQGRKGTQWLVGCTGQNGRTQFTKINKGYGQVFIVKPWFKHDRGKLESLRQNASSDYPTPEDMRNLFDADQKQLIVNGHSVGSVTVNWDVVEAPTKLSDQEWARLDIDSQLHRIATAFKLQDKLSEILSR